MKTAQRKLITFDLNTVSIVKAFGTSAPSKIYGEIKAFFSGCGFKHTQGSEYSSIYPLDNEELAEVIDALYATIPILNDARYVSAIRHDSVDEEQLQTLKSALPKTNERVRRFTNERRTEINNYVATHPELSASKMAKILRTSVTEITRTTGKLGIMLDSQKKDLGRHKQRANRDINFAAVQEYLGNNNTVTTAQICDYVCKKTGNAINIATAYHYRKEAERLDPSLRWSKVAEAESCRILDTTEQRTAEKIRETITVLRNFMQEQPDNKNLSQVPTSARIPYARLYSTARAIPEFADHFNVKEGGTQLLSVPTKRKLAILNAFRQVVKRGDIEQGMKDLQPYGSRIVKCKEFKYIYRLLEDWAAMAKESTNETNKRRIQTQIKKVDYEIDDTLLDVETSIASAYDLPLEQIHELYMA